MNNLSWFIYLANVADNVPGLAWLLISVSILGGIACFIWWLIISFNPKDDDIKSSKVQFNKIRVVGVSFALLGWSLAIFMPSRQTMILMAGSEMGEQFIKSDTMKNIVNPGADLVKAWIKNETDKLLSDKAKK